MQVGGRQWRQRLGLGAALVRKEATAVAETGVEKAVAASWQNSTHRGRADEEYWVALLLHQHGRGALQQV